MAQVLIRDIEPEVVEKLKSRAAAANRSLEAELRFLLRSVVQEEVALERAQSEIERIRAMFAGRTFSDSTELLREDREQ